MANGLESESPNAEPNKQLQALSIIGYCCHYENKIALSLIEVDSYLQFSQVYYCLDFPEKHGHFNSCIERKRSYRERHKNSRQTRFYLTPTVCKSVCRLFLCSSHTPTWICRHELTNLSLPCESRLKRSSNMAAPY